jgi:hypothetical protein
MHTHSGDVRKDIIRNKIQRFLQYFLAEFGSLFELDS